MVCPRWGYVQVTTQFQQAFGRFSVTAPGSRPAHQRRRRPVSPQRLLFRHPGSGTLVCENGREFPSHPHAGRYQVLRNTVIACAVDMQRSAINKLRSLPAKKASFVEPMECLSVPRLPEGSQWLWEIKLDGYRALAVKSGSDVTLFSGRRKSLNRQFPYIVERLADLPDGTVVDVELVGGTGWCLTRQVFGGTFQASALIQP